jgi:hypothetical protein
MPLSLFAMMDSVMTRPYAVRCGKSRPGVAKPPGRGARIMGDATLTGNERRGAHLLPECGFGYGQSPQNQK